MALSIKEMVVSDLVVADGLVTRGKFYCLFPEIVSFEDLGLVTGDVWETWVFNGPTFEPSVYSGFAFNSYALDEGTTYAVNETGIYAIDSATDGGAAIHSGVALSPSTFGILNRKRFRQGFFDIEGSAPFVRGEVPGGLGASLPIVGAKVMFPRSLVHKRWTFLVADFDELGQIELFPVVLTR